MYYISAHLRAKAHNNEKISNKDFLYREKKNSNRFQWKNDEQVLYFWQRVEFHKDVCVVCTIKHRKLFAGKKGKESKRIEWKRRPKAN